MDGGSGGGRGEVRDVLADVGDGCGEEEVLGEEGKEELEEGGDLHGEGRDHAPVLWVRIKLKKRRRIRIRL